MSRPPRRHSVHRDLASARLGFTLLELLIVLAIIGVIAALVIPRFLGQQRTATIKAAKASIHGLEQALNLYAVAHDAEFPTGNQDVLMQLIQPVDRDGKPEEPYLDSLPKDPWGQAFYYEYPNTKAQTTKPAIWSSGPNRVNDNGGGDDINNWSDLGL
ncbi:MAG: type II secretion system major pseudopilin GspG [Planctomycetaceae bacterium]|nr:type II secretion system major pseudopilin GspG [Planctomycetaceae bacterium]